MIKRTLRGLWARKRRVIGTSTAIVLGVAFLVGTLVLGDTFDAGFSKVFEQANAGTAVVVRNGSSIETDAGRERPNISADLAPQLEAIPGVAKVVGQIDGTMQILGSDGKAVGGQGPPTTAGNWIDDPGLNPYHVTSGKAPTKTGEAVIDAASAKTGKLHVGDTFTVRTPDAVELHLVGIVGFGSDDSMGGSTYVGLTEPQAVQLLGAKGEVSSFRISSDGTASDSEIQQAAAKVLPSKIEAITGAELTAEQRADIEGDFLGFLKTFLLAFAGVALVVATFSISNTFTIISAQRSRESALMRAIGASRGQVLSSAVFEAAVIGVVSAAVGLAAGVGLAGGLRALLAGFGLDLPGDSLEIRPSVLITSFAVGMVVTLVAAALPAIRSARVAPIEALRDSAAESVAVSKIRAAIGVLMGLAGVGIVVTATSSADSAVAKAGLGSLLVFVAAVVLGPVVARPAASVVGAPVAASRGLVGRLARRNAMRNPRRTAGSSLALLIGAAVVALFATFGASLSHSIDQTVQRSFGGDLVVTPEGFSGAGLSTKLPSAIADLPEVDDVVALSAASVKIGGSTQYPTAGDPKAMESLLDLDVQQGSMEDLAPGQVAVTEKYATDHHLRMGSPVKMTFADTSNQTFRVGAIYGVGELLGDIVMTDQDWTPHAIRPGSVAILIGLKDGTSLDQGRHAVETVADQHGGPQVQDRQQYIDSVAGQVDQLLTLVYGLLVLAIVIALIGLANTLSLSIHERTRELGLLRAVGLTRNRLRSMVRWESVITATVGTGFGLGIGTFLGWGLVRALSAQEGFVSFQLPTATLGVVLVLSMGAGILAALRPAHRASKLDVLAAIAER